jgi:hypothetical protein
MSLQTVVIRLWRTASGSGAYKLAVKDKRRFRGRFEVQVLAAPQWCQDGTVFEWAVSETGSHQFRMRV